MKILNCYGDKSISHRSIIFASIANGTSHIQNLAENEDCISTLEIFKALGVKFNKKNNIYIVHGVGLKGLYPLNKKEPINLYCGNSGTTMRLLSGILSAQNFSSILSGDSSLSSRPMQRIVKPLTLMNAIVTSNNGLAPIKFIPSTLQKITYNTGSSSAQVKSCILLAGLCSNNEVEVTEVYKSRDHTERMIKAFGAKISINKNTVKLQPCSFLKPTNIIIPNDISSAAFFIVAALIKPNSHILIPNVNINPTRAGILNIANRMGCKIKLYNIKNNFEPSADIEVKYTDNLRPINILPEEIPSLIDEIPIISLLLTQANGQSIIENVEELKFKESNRLDAIVNGLQTIGADISFESDRIIINGKSKLFGGNIKTQSDHRIAMTFAIADLISSNKIEIDDSSCVNISYPTFWKDYEDFIM